ncbi:unnamed protein product [Peniophora sp. CBMAI 1063]|nr:unnamed protein product [Peniophora sp. CBMAI 1063]
MEHNAHVLDMWRKHLLGPRLQELYSGKPPEERKRIHASRIRSILERLLGVASLEMAKKGYELLMQEANFPLNSPHPTVTAMMALVVAKAGDPAHLTSRRKFTHAVYAALDYEGGKNIRQWYGDGQWWDYIDQEPESEPEAMFSASSASPTFLQPFQLAPIMKRTSPTPEPPLPDGHDAFSHSLQWQADRAPFKKSAQPHNARTSPRDALVMAGDMKSNDPDEEDWCVGGYLEKGTGKDDAIPVRDDDEEQHLQELVPKKQPFKGKPKMKPKFVATTLTERARNPATWYVRGLRYTPSRPAEQVYDHLEPGQQLDLFSLFQLSEMHGMRQADLSEYVIPCKYCHKERTKCIFRPSKSSIGGACASCYLKSTKCTAAGQRIALGDNVRFLHPNGFRGTKPQLRAPELHVRVNLLQKLLDKGVLKEWPDFIDEDGQINHKDFAKDPKFEVSEMTSLFLRVPPYCASESEYLAAYPRCHEVQVPAFVKQEIVDSAIGGDAELLGFNKNVPQVKYDDDDMINTTYGEAVCIQGEAVSLQGQEAYAANVEFQDQDMEAALDMFAKYTLFDEPGETDDTPVRLLPPLLQAREVHVQALGQSRQIVEQPSQSVRTLSSTAEKASQTVGTPSSTIEKALQTLGAPSNVVEEASQTLEMPSLVDEDPGQVSRAIEMRGSSFGSETSKKAGFLSIQAAPEHTAELPVAFRSVPADVTHIRVQVDNLVSIVSELSKRVCDIQTALGSSDSSHSASFRPSTASQTTSSGDILEFSAPRIAVNGHEAQILEAGATTATSEAPVGSTYSVMATNHTRPGNASTGGLHPAPAVMNSPSAGCSSEYTSSFSNATSTPFILPGSSRESESEGTNALEGLAAPPISRSATAPDIVDDSNQHEVDTISFHAPHPMPSYYLVRRDRQGYRDGCSSAVDAGRALYSSVETADDGPHQVGLGISDDLESAGPLLALSASDNVVTSQASHLPPYSSRASETSLQPRRTVDFLTLEKEIARTSASNETTRYIHRVTPTTPYMPKIIEAQVEEGGVESEDLSSHIEGLTSGARGTSVIGEDLNDGEHGRRRGYVHAEGWAGENAGMEARADRTARKKTKAKNQEKLEDVRDGSGDQSQDDPAYQGKTASKRESATSAIAGTLRLTRSRASSIARLHENHPVAVPTRLTRSRASSVETAQATGEGGTASVSTRSGTPSDAKLVVDGGPLQFTDRKRKRAGASKPETERFAGQSVPVKRQRMTTNHD